ncbi:unnamed protein product, partial [Hapterophycus canaliculatus]
RRVRTTLVGPVARRHFQAMSIARWGESCRCRYAVVHVKADVHGRGKRAEKHNTRSPVHGGTNGGGSSSSSSSSSSTIAANTSSRNKSDISGSDNSTTTTGTTISSSSSDEDASGSKNQGGAAVHDSDDDAEADWLAFYLRRIGHRAAWPSPLDLLQEHYAEDAYRLLACCILCSRTSGGDTVKDAVAAFFKACPTPSSVLSADQEELRKTLLPLGLNR